MKHAMAEVQRWFKKAVVGWRFRKSIEQNEHAAAQLDAIVREVLQK